MSSNEENVTEGAEGLSQREVLMRLVDQARKDPEFFHALVFDPEKVLAQLSYLDRRERATLVALQPEDVISGLAGLNIGIVGQCGSTCGADSCGKTCGGSCFDTCKSSCGSTCGARSCDGTTSRVVQFTDRAELLETLIGVLIQIFRPVIRGR